MPPSGRLTQAEMPPILRSATTARSLSSLTPERLDQKIVLSDGRFLGYAEFGDLSGYPLLFFHGFPSSRLEAHGLARLARARRLRVITPDRPGFGLSTFRPNRRILDWPEDMRELVRALGLQRFAVLGGSGGGPYALACAKGLPAGMMSAVGLLSSAGPWVGEGQEGRELTREVMWVSRATAVAAKWFPWVLRVATDALVGACRWVAGTGSVTRRIDAWLEKTAEKERSKADSDGTPNESIAQEEHLSIEHRRNMLIRTVFEGFAQGAEGFVQEARLLTEDWGFRFEDINYDRVQIWHGRQDKNAPIRQIRYMAARLPHCELREFDKNHFAIAEHLEEILEELISEGKPRNPEKSLINDPAQETTAQ